MVRDKQTSFQKRPVQTRRQFFKWLLTSKTRAGKREALHYKYRAWGYRNNYLHSTNMINSHKLTWEDIQQWTTAFGGAQYPNLTRLD